MLLSITRRWCSEWERDGSTRDGTSISRMFGLMWMWIFVSYTDRYPDWWIE